MSRILDRQAFIRAETALLPVPHAPEIMLHLADEAVPLWQKTEDELGAIGLPPPFWAFAWAGGQALARYVLDNANLVAGRRVLDLGSGSGLVAIAAAKAGAAVVRAVEIDPRAVAAIALNARENGVAVTAELDDILDAGAGGADVVLAGDVFYSKPMADRMTRFLLRAARAGALVLAGDPGRAFLPRERFRALATYDVPVPPALETVSVKHTTVWEMRASTAVVEDGRG